MKLRVGVIGTGRIGQIAHLQHFAADPRCEVTALADTRPGLARSAADKFGVARVYTHHTELLADPAVDAVVVVTHRYHTAAVVRDALMAGKHVLSEKPMAFDVETARALVALAARQGVVYAVGYMKRHDPWVLGAQQAMAGSGEMAPPRLIRVHCFVGNPDRTDDFVMTDEARPQSDLSAAMPSWLPRRLQASYDRFLNVYSHDLDLALLLGGPDLKLEYAANQGDDAHHVVLRNGAVITTIDAASLPGTEWREGFEIVSPRGTMAVQLPWPLDPAAQGDVILYTPEMRRLVPHDMTWAFKAQAADFVRAALGGPPPRSPGSSALRSMELAAEIFRSYAGNSKAPDDTLDQGEKLHVAH